MDIIIKCLLSDQFIFPAFQACFLLFTIFALAKDRGFFTPKGSIKCFVKRGEKS